MSVQYGRYPVKPHRPRKPRKRHATATEPKKVSEAELDAAAIAYFDTSVNPALKAVSLSGLYGAISTVLKGRSVKMAQR